MAIAHATRVLQWNENLTEDESPPEWMWPFEWELESWFERVKADRDARYGINRGDDDREDVPMMTNELAAGMRRR